MNNFCNICGKNAQEARTKRLVRDHNHTTGFIRGVLCDDCNINLGVFESKKDSAPPIILARNKVPYIKWLSEYRERIFYHLSCNTGIKYEKFVKYKNVLPKQHSYREATK